jgi:uncharacterized membrane protein
VVAREIQRNLKDSTIAMQRTSFFSFMFFLPILSLEGPWWVCTILGLVLASFLFAYVAVAMVLPHAQCFLDFSHCLQFAEFIGVRNESLQKCS